MASMKSEIEDKILTCPLCLNILTDPKCLPCIHTFCRACLEMHIQHTANRGMFQCPECRETVWAQPGGVDAYRTNFFINRLKDLKFNTAPSDESPKCRSHPAKSVTLFCEQCDVCVCADCIVQKHKGHPCLSFSDARQDREKTLKNRLNDLEHATLGGKDSLRTQAKKVESLRQRQADVSDNMKAATQRLIEGIQEASKKTIRSLGDATRPVLEQHITYLDDLRTYTNQMESDMANMNLLVKKSSDVEMLDAYKDTANKASNFCETNFANKEDTLHKSTSQMKATYNELFGKFASQCKELIQQTKKELHEDVSLLKSADHKIAKHRRSFRGKGKISTSDLSKTPPKLGKKVREFGRPPQETRTITGLCVHAKTGHVYCCVGDKAFKLGGFLRKWRDIHSRLNIGSEAVNDVGESDDTLVFSVRSENGSPCKLAKYNTNSSSTETIELGFISEIPGIFICKDRSILVTDFSRGAFHKVSWTGETLRMFGTTALSQPWYIAETTGGQIVVSDNVGKSDVCLFSGEGSWRKSLKDETIAKGADNYLCDPYSVRTDSNGRIYVACCWTNCVLVFSGTGEYLSAVVSPEDGITHPISLHLTDDKIYIGHKDGVTSYSLIM